jgi:hypothetical protein
MKIITKKHTAILAMPGNDKDSRYVKILDEGEIQGDKEEQALGDSIPKNAIYVSNENEKTYSIVKNVMELGQQFEILIKYLVE